MNSKLIVDLSLTFFRFSRFSDSIGFSLGGWYNHCAVAVCLKNTTKSTPNSVIAAEFEFVEDKSLDLVSKDTDENMSIDAVFKLMVPFI